MSAAFNQKTAVDILGFVANMRGIDPYIGILESVSYSKMSTLNRRYGQFDSDVSLSDMESACSGIP